MTPSLILLFLFGLLFLWGFLAPTAFAPLLCRIGKSLDRFAYGKFTWVWIILAVLAISALYSAFVLLPEPHVHDEFSYLLQADTFAHGRLSNPPHPHWKFFESYHILCQPTYASKYPPGQGAFLAFGQILGRPIYGVWLSTAFAVAAVFWMLRAIVRPRLALLGAALIFANPQVLLWNWNFWGGSVALLGAALALGGAFRVARNRFDYKASVLTGSGISLLAITRPFEGVVLLAICFVLLLVRVIRRKKALQLAIPTLWPLAVIVTVTMIFIGLNNAAVTGSPLSMPYALYEKTYASSPIFLWQHEQPHPAYNHPVMQRFYELIAKDFASQKTPAGYWHALKKKASRFDKYFWAEAGLLLLIPAVFVLRRDYRARFAVLAFCGFVAIGILPVVYSQPHYAAPALPLLIIVAVGSLGVISRVKIAGRPSGRFWANGLVSVCLIWSLARFPFVSHEPFPSGRPDMKKHLTETKKRFLIFMQYGPEHALDDEWVYNEADIDNSQIVWARDMGDSQNDKLIACYKDREALLINPDTHKVTILSSK